MNSEAEGVEGREIHFRMSAVYDEYSMACSRGLELRKRLHYDNDSEICLGNATV